MTPTRRWCIVAIGAVVLGLLPFAGKLLPASPLSVSIPQLLARAQASSTVMYSGNVESSGTLRLPLSDQFSDVANLFGERSTMRVWWRGEGDWRVDKLATTGETDLFHDPLGTISWNYEDDQAVRTLNPRVRLPQSYDVLPPVFSRLVLRDAHPDEVTGLGPRRVAGLDAAGLRLRPSESDSSIDHVDMWVDPDNGLPLSVEAWAKGATNPAFTSTFVDVSLDEPKADVTQFSLPPGADIRYEGDIDVAAAANRYSPVKAPADLVGFSRHDTGIGAVGVYGRGVTTLIAIPLWDPAADPLRKQLEVTPGSAASTLGTTLTVGPLNLLLTPQVFADHSWLLAGTVTPQTLVDAAAQLSTGNGDRGLVPAIGQAG